MAKRKRRKTPTIANEMAEGMAAMIVLERRRTKRLFVLTWLVVGLGMVLGITL